MTESVVEILLVEDNPSDVELTLHALRKNNFTNRIHVVRDGEEAMEFIFCEGSYSGRRPEEGPKVVLLDLHLPKVSGLEVRDIVDSYQLGVNSYIVKPVDFNQFTEAVRTLGLYWILLNNPPILR